MGDKTDHGRDALLSINRALAGGISSQEVFQTIVSQAVAECRAERGFLLFDEQDVAATINSDQGDYSGRVVNYVRTKKEALLTSDAPQDPRLDTSKSIFDMRIRSVMAAPLRADGDVIGVLYLDSLSTTRDFTNDDLELLQALADQAALAFKLAALKLELEKQMNTTKELTELADEDGLTGLHNRRALDRNLKDLLQNTANYPVSLIMIDIDHFKVYNDTNGHPAGDEVLKKLAGILGTGLRDPDFAARYGGEELVIVLAKTALEKSRVVAERLRMHVERTAFAQESTQPGGRLTISLGVAAAPMHGRDPASLIKAADDALYLAKRQGKNCVVTAS